LYYKYSNNANFNENENQSLKLNVCVPWKRKTGNWKLKFAPATLLMSFRP